MSFLVRHPYALTENKVEEYESFACYGSMVNGFNNVILFKKENGWLAVYTMNYLTYTLMVKAALRAYTKAPQEIISHEVFDTSTFEDIHSIFVLDVNDERTTKISPYLQLEVTGYTLSQTHPNLEGLGGLLITYHIQRKLANGQVRKALVSGFTDLYAFTNIGTEVSPQLTIKIHLWHYRKEERQKAYKEGFPYTPEIDANFDSSYPLFTQREHSYLLKLQYN